MVKGGQPANVGSAKKSAFGTFDDTLSEPDSATSLHSSSKLMLRKLKEAASLAISVTTGKKPQFGVKEKNLTNIIPGFGYALMEETRPRRYFWYLLLHCVHQNMIV